MLGIIILLILALASRRYPYPLMYANAYALLIFLWGIFNDDWRGALLRAMMGLAFGLMFFFTLDRTRPLLRAWLSTLMMGLATGWFWPYLVI